MKWFHGQASAVFSRSSAYRFQLGDLGIAEEKMRVIPPSVNTEKFHPSRRDDTIWPSLGIKEPHRLLYVGRVSVEKNLPMLTEAFGRLCEKRRDAALVVAGDGPHLEAMRRALTHLPAYFLGFQNDAQLGALYASADLLVFPSRTDTLGQVVMEAQASGLPVLVTPDGGPKESIEDGRTGIVVPEQTPARWAVEIENLLDDGARRQRMGQAAAQRATRWSLGSTFDAFWLEHLRACEQASAEPAGFIPPAVAITK